MKPSKFFFFLIFVFITETINAQLDCSNIPISQSALKKSQSSSSRDCNVLIKVYYHLYYRDDGSGNIPESRPDDITGALNGYFEDSGISFFHNNCETRIVTDTDLYNNYEKCNYYYKPTAHEDGIDIHVKHEGTGGGSASASGIPGKEILVSGDDNWSDPLLPSSLSPTIAHEMGHCLGLFHTHHGMCVTDPEDDCAGNPIGSGNSTDGDYVGDTPRDPKLGISNVNESCVWDGDIKCNDGLGPFTPPIHNYMSYSRSSCMSVFTDGQITRMCDFLLPEIIHTQNLLDFAPVLSSSTITNLCPNLYVDLNDLFIGDLPDGAELIWSKDDDSSDGISIQESLIISYNSTFFAYFYYEETGCYSPPGSVEVIMDYCCYSDLDFTVSDDMTIEKPIFFGGNVIVGNGVTLTIKDRTEFGEYKKLIVQNGGSVIIEDYAILKACVGAYRWEGIEVESGGSLVVNEGYVYSALNAIWAKPGSSVDLSHFIALGNGSYDKTRVAIFLDGEVNVVRLENTKIVEYYIGIYAQNSNNYYNINKGEIIDCFTGIKLESSPARISGFGISAHNSGISAIYSPGMLIEKNGFNTVQNSYYGDSEGINMWWCDGSVIRDNIIGANWLAPNTGISLYLSNGGTITDMNIIKGASTGIFAFNTDFSIIQNEIGVTSEFSLNKGALTLMFGNGNQISNNFIDAQNVTFGINTRLCSGTQIENNDITTTYNATYDRAAGIKSEGCNGEIITNNIVNGIGNTDGIIANNTAGNTYNCNDATVDGTNEAQSVLYNSIGQSVKGNHLSGGKDLLIRSVIGEQVHEGNEFVGGNTYAENDQIATDSRFYVNSIYTFHMPANPNPIEWFKDEADVHNYYICVNSPGPNWIPFWDDEVVVCDYFMDIVTTYGYDSPQYIRMIQTMLRYDQQRINFDLPDCVLDDPILSECWEDIVKVEQGLLSSTNNTRNNERNQLLNEINGLSDAYDQGVGDTYLNNQRTLLQSLTSSVSLARPEFESELSTIKSDLDNIDCNDFIIDVAQPILQEYIRFVEEDDRDNFDYTKVINYSRLCADEYGPYIHLARAIAYLDTDEYFDQYDICRIGDLDPRLIKGIDYETRIYPNPSSGLATIDFGKEITAVIKITDISGIQIYKKSIVDISEISLDLSEHTGVHIINIIRNDGTLEVLKHITIK